MRKPARTISLLLILNWVLLSAGFSQALVRNIQVSGNEKISLKNYLEWDGISAGQVYNKSQIHAGARNIIKNLQSLGYLFAQVNGVGIEIDSAASAVDLTWKIFEGKRCLFESIEIEADSAWQKPLINRLSVRPGEVYSNRLVNLEIGFLSRFLADNGHPFSNIRVEKTDLQDRESYIGVRILLTVDAGPLTKIEEIRVSGNEVTKSKVILRELALQPGMEYDQQAIDQIPHTLERLGYFKTVKPVVPLWAKEGKIGLLIEIEEGNSSSFDGVVGYIPPDENLAKQEGYFTGLLNTSFRNPFGDGRKFDLYWEKPDKYSEQFHLYYEEPWVFDWPVNAGIGLERIVRDTTYIEKKYLFKTRIKLSANLRLTLGVNNTSIIPDSAASRDLRMVRNFMTSGEAGIEYDTRDYPLNPRQGIFYYTQYSFGIKENTGPSYLLRKDDIEKREELQKAEMQLKYFQPLWQNQVLAFSLFGAQVKSNHDQLQISDHFWFGGARSLRGYRENQLHGTVVSWLNMEYRFLLGRNSRIFAFNDWGYYSYKTKNGLKEEYLPGYGIGIRFETGLGIMGFDYGLGRDDSFSNGKIHFGIVNTF